MKSPYLALFILFSSIPIIYFFKTSLNPFGLPFVVFGLFMYFHSKHTMGKYWSIKIEKKPEIIKKGFFKYIRHPLYTGLLIAGFGGAVSTENLVFLAYLIFVCIPFVYKRAILEEETLKSKEYEEYKKATGMFFPKIKNL